MKNTKSNNSTQELMTKKWKKINKPAAKARNGSYEDWKHELAVEGEDRCVYCAIHHQELGGERNFHVEHYKPKSNPKFSALKNDYNNLFYACPICNTFKSCSWFDVTLGDWDTIHFPDPSLYDYGDFFEIKDDIYLVHGLHTVGKFLVERFHLNRFQLIRYRRFETASENLNEILQTIKEIMACLEELVEKGVNEAFAFYKDISQYLAKIIQLQQAKFKLPLYTPNELRQDNK